MASTAGARKQRTLPRWLIVVVTFVCACSKESEFIDAREEVRNVMARLYVAYGGGAIARAATRDVRKAGIRHNGARDESTIAAEGMIRDVDRTMFESQCLEVGRGRTVFFLTAKARTFFSKPEVRETCRAAATADLKARRLATELGVEYE